MALPQPDVEFLDARGLPYTVTEEANMTCLVFHGYALPKGYNIAQSDLLIRLSPGFPDVPPDMWWFSPAIARDDGQAIPATEHVENHLGRAWQRWSRHLGPGQWRSGTDDVQTYLAMIARELQRTTVKEAVA
ncbi:E2/UBC family protein [Pelomonas sp. SE-A7]|uniref:E2/UBC family protein n=1 Tax=Pelomonas sp. SE-A7 TaxID=3054953 RepID=UPI00259D1E31|nr:E2/UBC family protein [Pelomonas sp. SE-A7]MDM4768268.1 E2/UBC family protein [Pelomonas sp. SE-A7]